MIDEGSASLFEYPLPQDHTDDGGGVECSVLQGKNTGMHKHLATGSDSPLKDRQSNARGGIEECRRRRHFRRRSDTAPRFIVTVKLSAVFFQSRALRVLDSSSELTTFTDNPDISGQLRTDRDNPGSRGTAEVHRT